MTPPALIHPLRRRSVLAALAGLGVAGLALPARAQSSGETGRFVLDAWAGPPLPVWTHRPAGADAATPLVIVMHGQGRNASTYRDQWIAAADRFGFIIAAPEFARADFPLAEHYNQGGMFGLNGAPLDRSVWAFSAIAGVFEAVRAAFGLTAQDFGIYGHSAGSQFVHRYLLFAGETRIAAAVAANAGWYTMPDPAIAFPFGIGGAGLTREAVAAWLAAPLTILLGTADIQQTSSLNMSAEAMVQGSHRLERGQRFFGVGVRLAETLGVPFNWRLGYVPGVGHDNALMAAPAAGHLTAGLSRRG